MNILDYFLNEPLSFDFRMMLNQILFIPLCVLLSWVGASLYNRICDALELFIARYVKYEAYKENEERC